MNKNPEFKLDNVKALHSAMNSSRDKHHGLSSESMALEHRDNLLAELREFIDVEVVSNYIGHDILPEIASDPDLVIYYIGVYTRLLEENTN